MRPAPRSGMIALFTQRVADDRRGRGDEATAWTTAELGLPRHFTFWREPDLRLFERSGWSVLSVERVAGHEEHGLFVLARALDPD